MAWANGITPATPWVERSVREINQKFPALGPGGSYAGHGEAVHGSDSLGARYAFDFWSTDKAVHDVVFPWLMANAERLGILYVISWRRIWSVARASEGVRVYNRYDPAPNTASQDHKNHIHVSFDPNAKEPTVITTSVRGATWNLRNRTALADKLFPSRAWSKRLPVIVQVIKDVGPSVLGVQECRTDMAGDITQKLGAVWTFYGEGTSKIIWRSDKWLAVDEFETDLTTPAGAPVRHLVGVRLQSVATQGSFWAGVTHLTANYAGEAEARKVQITEAVGHLKARAQGHPSVLFGDFNDAGYESKAGVIRDLARAAGYRDTRALLTDAEMEGDSRASFNGWKPTKSDGRWLDDILFPASVDPYKGTLVKVGPDSPEKYPVYGSDHNLVRVSFRFDTPISS